MIDDEISDLVLGGDLSDTVIGKQADPTKLFRMIAIVLGVFIVGNYFGSILLEQYRLQALKQEISGVCLNAINCAVEEMQDMGEENLNFIFDDYGNLSDSYEQYLDTLSSISDDNELKRVVNLLKYGDIAGETYTPLSFNLTYLDVNQLSNIVNNNLSMIFDANNTTAFGSESNGSLLEELIMGSERTEFGGCTVSIEKMNVINITDVNALDSNEKALYRAVYGTDSQSASVLDGAGLTDNHYLIVYQLRYTIKWTPYTRTFFFQRAYSSAKKNSDNFLAYPELTETFNQLYYITN